MVDDELKRQIESTQYEVFPLGKMLPKETVLAIFLDMYHATENKADLMKNSSETKRIREAYWGLFACVAIDIIEKKDHLMLFPEDDRNDISLISEDNLSAIRPKMKYLELDIKEYTKYSFEAGFNEFISTIINPGRVRYGVVVGIHGDINELDLKSLFLRGDDCGVILISSDNHTDTDILKSRVIFILQDKVIFDDILDLAECIDVTKERVVFQDELRGIPT
jgi:hypothetical protein